MRKAVVAMMWLLVALALPVSVGLDGVCRLAHASPSAASLTQHDPHAHHHDASHDADPDQGAPRPIPHDHGTADASCCHMMGVSSAGLPSQTAAFPCPSRMAQTVYWAADHPIRGRSPPPALDPPRA